MASRSRSEPVCDAFSLCSEEAFDFVHKTATVTDETRSCRSPRISLRKGNRNKSSPRALASRLPRERVAAGVVFRDEDSRILMVEPVYKPGT
jgi:hypothetical protein